MPGPLDTVDAAGAGSLAVTLARAPDAPHAASHAATQAASLGQQFESLLLRQLVEAMQATVPDSGLMGPASGPKTMYQDMITDALATQIARSGGLGIARLLAPTLGGPTAGGAGAGAAAAVVERAHARIPAKQAPVPGVSPEAVQEN